MEKKKKRHRWGEEYRMRSECKDCGCIRNRTQLVAKYELMDGTTIRRNAPNCNPNKF